MRRTPMIKFVRNVLIAFVLSTPFAMADFLPSPENLAIEGNTLVWDGVEGATGYNVYLENRYFDTVKDVERYQLTQPGIYRVVAFDDAGNFGSQHVRGNQVEFAGSGDSVSVTNNFVSSVVQVVCNDVGPGESCTASCASTSTQLSPPRFTSYMSGGACATSDIVEADAFVSQYTYQCTVPTFSGEVIAQAICVHF